MIPPRLLQHDGVPLEEDSDEEKEPWSALLLMTTMIAVPPKHGVGLMLNVPRTASIS